MGPFLIAIFVLATIQMDRAAAWVAGKMTLLVPCIMLTLCLSESNFTIGVVWVIVSRHTKIVLICLILTSVFIHVFLNTPSVFLILGAARLFHLKTDTSWMS